MQKHGLSLYKTCLKESKIEGAGRGVFTRVACKEKTLLCFYDGYILDNLDPMTADEQEYAIEYKNTTMVGYKIPKRRIGIAQLMNDASVPRFNFSYQSMDLDERVFKILKSLLAYTTESLDKENIYTDRELNFYAARDLDANEECYFHYGPEYWCGRNMEYTQDTSLYAGLALANTLIKRQRNLLKTENMEEVLVSVINRPNTAVLPFKMRREVEQGKISFKEAMYSFDERLQDEAERIIAQGKRESLLINLGD
ncbi:SET domain-containing protein [Brazilian cedratvirus IHUMI]|uniref:SET domain-containing protein n=1 Tax=Brazilian cedratvirus IHUMI TaxID=2126980 RepID=A0A2R8FFB5_9VIRU|nr:SET domain-containing protein [Brazilian cedratvirus IHUMI]